MEFKTSNVSNLSKICGDQLCSDVPNETIASSHQSSSLVQYQLGIELDQIECNEKQAIAIKSTTHSPACVNVGTVDVLQERNWAVSETIQNTIFEALVEVRTNIMAQKSSQISDVGLTITNDAINNQRFLVIERFGWHRLHNVEITISSSDFSASIRSKTTDRGDLDTLWQIPDSVGGKMHNIFATDGIYEFELDIPITLN